MTRYLVTRFLGILFVMFAVSILAFVLMHSVPGGPFSIDESGRLPEATKQAQLERYGLDRPLPVQYVKWVSAMFRGDFGIPFQSPTETVTGLIARAWPVTIKIGVPTIIIAFTFGSIFGIVAATHQNTWIDYIATFSATLGIVLPNFVIAMWLMLFFSVYLGWLEPGGWGKPQHYIMPVMAYSLAPMALVARYTRSSMLEVMKSDHVRTARAKGLSGQAVMIRHVGRNALIPLVTILLPEIPNILTGSIFIESVFRIPGLGRYFVTSTQTRDYPMILAMVMLVALLWGLTYLITDILYGILDPRVRAMGGRRGQ